MTTSKKNQKILVVGAGFSGATIARELADAGFFVDIIDQRNHVAGNAYDYVNDIGIREHKYGPHLFHTSIDIVIEWVNKFSEWVPYYHKVKALLNNGMHVAFPVNNKTLEIVGRENILDTFFRPYTYKMWGVHLEQLDPQIINRVPIRNDDCELYFPKDKFQALPKNGYTNFIKNVLDNKNINLQLNTPFNKSIVKKYFYVFNSMPIDEYFDYRFGHLPYRSIKFHNFNLPVPYLLPTVTVNFTHSKKYSRVTEWKLLPNHGNSEEYTSITIEEPCDYIDNNYERYYPVKDISGDNTKLYNKYFSLIPHNMSFIGRCGQYVYIDMHQAINSSLLKAKKFITFNR